MRPSYVPGGYGGHCGYGPLMSVLSITLRSSRYSLTKEGLPHPVHYRFREEIYMGLFESHKETIATRQRQKSLSPGSSK
jgi:hypothetical protein